MDGRSRPADAWARARLAIASFSGAMVLTLGAFFWAGYDTDTEGSKFAGVAIRWGVGAAVAALLAVGIAAAVLAIAAAVRGRIGAPPADPANAAAAGMPSGRRVGFVAVFGAVNLLIIPVGVLHILVWNPLARVPGVELAEIYERMHAMGEGTLAGAMAGTWAVFWAIVTVLYVAACGIPKLAPILATRHIAVVGLLVLGGTCVFHWMAGFHSGMSLADTFATSGGDAAVTGPLIALTGQACFVAALFVALVPARSGHAASPVTA